MDMVSLPPHHQIYVNKVGWDTVCLGFGSYLQFATCLSDGVVGELANTVCKCACPGSLPAHQTYAWTRWDGRLLVSGACMQPAE
jgi:hypothetical protein